MIRGIGQSIINGTYDLKPAKTKGVICPNCDSTTQVRKYDWDIYFDNDEEITIYRDYVCNGCGHYFRAKQLYRADGWEMVCEEGDE